MINYEDVKKRLLNLSEDDIFFGEKSSLQDIKEAERSLGNVFPESFKRYLMDFGYTGIDGDEILVVGKKIPKGDNIVPSAFFEWEGCKPDYYIPRYFIPFSPDGMGNFHCFDTRSFEKDECPIIFYNHEDFYEYVRNQRVPETTHENFLEWLNEVIDKLLKEKAIEGSK